MEHQMKAVGRHWWVSLFTLVWLASCTALTPAPTHTPSPTEATEPPVPAADPAGEQGSDRDTSTGEATASSAEFPAMNVALTMPAGWQVLDESEQSVAIGTSSGTPRLTITQLTFAGNGDTFLEAIDAALAAQETVDHRYLTSGELGSGQWQGEMLTHADGVLAFLQLARNGSTPALKWEGSDPDILLAVLDSLRALQPGTEPAADVQVEFVEARQTSEDTWSFSVTLRHPDTGWNDYADGWQILTPDGSILGTRILLHPHENEQPFTRSLNAVTIDPQVDTVLIRAHDLVSGYGSTPVSVSLDDTAEGENFRVHRQQ